MSALVLGGTGQVGAEVARLLAARHLTVRATTRNAASAPQVANVEWLEIDGDRPEVPAGAFDDVDRVFLLAPAGWADQCTFLLPWIRAAERAQVANAVLMTAFEPDDQEDSSFGRAEAALAATSIPHAVLRPSWFMQNFHNYWGEGIRREGVIRLPAGEGRVGFIDTRDIAAAAANLLGAPQVENRTFVLTGPEALNHADVARILSEVSGRPIRYEDVDDVTFRRMLVADGMPPEYANLVVDMFPVVRGNRASLVTDVVQSLTDAAPRTLASYARDYRDQLLS